MCPCTHSQHPHPAQHVSSVVVLSSAAVIVVVSVPFPSHSPLLPLISLLRSFKGLRCTLRQRMATWRWRRRWWRRARPLRRRAKCATEGAPNRPNPHLTPISLSRARARTAAAAEATVCCYCADGPRACRGVVPPLLRSGVLAGSRREQRKVADTHAVGQLRRGGAAEQHHSRQGRARVNTKHTAARQRRRCCLRRWTPHQSNTVAGRFAVCE